MSMKVLFTERQRLGLTSEEIKIGHEYLRKHRIYGKIPREEEVKVHEFFMVGATFAELHEQFPQYPMGQIIMTAALNGWVSDRDRLVWTLQDRIKARILKSFLGQIDFITTLLEVNNVETMKQMKQYILNPDKYPKPLKSISNLREYKDICELLMKIGSTTPKSSLTDFIKGEEKTPNLLEGKDAEYMLKSAVEDGSTEEFENKSSIKKEAPRRRGRSKKNMEDMHPIDMILQKESEKEPVYVDSNSNETKEDE